MASDGATVNSVALGQIKSVQILDRLFPTEASRRKEIEQNVPIGRSREPEEVAEMIAFLALSRARHIMGAMFPMDGGLLGLGFEMIDVQGSDLFGANRLGDQ